MKKIIFTLVMLIVAMSANADGLDRLARKYKKCKGAVYAASIDELDKLDTPSCVNVVIEKDGDKVDGIKKNYYQNEGERGEKNASASIG